jgi:hypothetical protein
MTSRSLALASFLAASPLIGLSACASNMAQDGAAGSAGGTGSSSSGSTGSTTTGPRETCPSPPPPTGPPPPSAPTCTSDSPIAIVADEYSIGGLAVDATNVYWSAGGDLKTVALTGGTPTVLAPGTAVAIAVDATNVYWADKAGSIYKVPIGGGAATVVASWQGIPAGLAIDATNVYWTSSLKGQGTVLQAPIAGGPAVVLASAQNDPRSIVVDATSVYWGNAGGSPAYGSVMKVPIGGGAALQLATSMTGPTGLAIDKSYVYWGNQGTWPETAINGTLMRVGMGGGAPETLASMLWTTGALAVDATNVYFTTPGVGIALGGVEACAVGGCGTQPSPLGNGPGAGSSTWQAGDMAIDATCVYWSTVPQCSGSDIPPCTWCTTVGIWKAAK